MADLLTTLDSLKPETVKLIGTFVTAIATLLGVVIAAFLGRILASFWLSKRDIQDKEVEWRNHAIELTKLDLERKLRTRKEGEQQPIRPSILDFLANYRDLQELGTSSPRDLYIEINEKRISKKSDD